MSQTMYSEWTETWGSVSAQFRKHPLNDASRTRSWIVVGNLWASNGGSGHAGARGGCFRHAGLRGAAGQQMQRMPSRIKLEGRTKRRPLLETRRGVRMPETESWVIGFRDQMRRNAPSNFPAFTVNPKPGFPQPVLRNITNAGP